MQSRQETGERRGSSMSAGAPAPESGADRRPSLAAGPKGANRAFGSATASSRRPSRMSVVAAAAAPGTAARRGSALPGPVPAEGADSTGTAGGPAPAPGAAGPLHPALDRIRSFSRRRSAFRGPGGAGKGPAGGWDTLSAAMDALDARVGGALQALREQNAAGLGHVRGLAASKSGRLRLGGTDAIDAAAAAADGQDEPSSPRAQLEAEAAQRPARLLARLKSSFKERALHRSGSSSARGRLEGNAEAAADEDGGKDAPQSAVEGALIPAVHAPPPSDQQPASGDAGASPGRTGGVRWGATEGGLDRLGWVRGLVQFSDFRQQQLHAAAQAALGGGGAADPGGLGGAPDGPAMDMIGWLDSGAGLRPGSGASSVPSSAGRPAGGSPPRSREEVALLQAWLQDMMAQAAAQAAGGPPPTPPQQPGDGAAAAVAGAAGASGASGGLPREQAAGDLADAALWVFGLAFEELQRQVGAECGERGALLGGLWHHAFNLVELRCSLAYEAIIGAVREELGAARRRAAAATAAQAAAEARVAESMYYSRDKFEGLEVEVKSLAQLLATAEEERERHAEEAALLRRANEAAGAQHAADSAKLAEELRLRLDLQHDKEELQATGEERARALAGLEAELARARADLARARADGLALTEDRARLEVELKRAQRELQASEIMGLGLREQLAARQAELGELSAAHAALQAEAATASVALLESQASLAGLQHQHQGLQQSAAERAAELEAELTSKAAELEEALGRAEAAEGARTATERAAAEAAQREAAVAQQLRQLAEAHEAQMGRLRQEGEARRAAEDELAAVRAGLQVAQQRLEGLGVVFASSAAHRTAAEAWRATGPISMARQVVAAVNQQLGELAARRAELQHELGAAKERWQAEEGVRVRLQEQLLEVRARESKAAKEVEALAASVARLEALRAAADAELAQQRRMLEEAEARCQASHKAGMEAAAEAKRLAPMEARAARLEEALRAAGAELERVQHEVTAHQQTIRKLLDEKGAALEQLAARSSALDAAQLRVRELAAAAHDRVQLAESKAQMEEELHALRQRCAASERLQGDSTHQLAVARRLLQDAAADEQRARLAQEAHACRAAAATHRREAMLLRDQLAASEGQLQFMERQLQAALHAPLAAAAAAAAGGGGAQQAVVDQLRRLLETREERIKQLDRLQTSLASSTAQLKHAQTELGARDREAAGLRAEVESVRRRLAALQASQAQAATRDLVAAVAADPGLPPEVAQALALDHARRQLRSELSWTRAKLAFVCSMAAGLRRKLAQAQADRAQAEAEGVCVEAHHLQQAVMDQRAFAAAYEAGAVQVKRVLMAVLQGLAELRRQLVAPAAADLPRLEQQLGGLAAALGSWVERYHSRTDEGCQADPLAEQQDWQHGLLAALPAARPTSPPPLEHVSALIVQVYAHHVRQLPLTGPTEPCPLADNVFEAAAAFFCERRGFSRQAALSPTGPVAALLAGARAHLQQPKQLLLGRLAGLAPSGGSGSSRSLQHPAAWQFFARLLCCLRALQGAGWEPLVKEWAGAAEGAPLPLGCVMDLLANLYNTDAPALLDSARRGLVPLVRQGRRGPVLDLDALLLALMNEYCDGSCPISPLSLPRRLTDGAPACGALGGGPSGGALAGSLSSVAQAVGASEAYLGGGAAAGSPADGKQPRSPMRKRIINLTAAADALPPLGSGAAARSPSPEPGSGGSGGGSPGAAQLGSRAGQVLSGMRALLDSNPALPVGLRSQLRASSPTGAARPGGDT